MSLWRRLFGSKPTLTPDLREQIRRSFNDAAADAENFPDSIDPRILHVRVLAETFGPMAGKRALDAGCGKGRFARALLHEQPEASIACMDIAEAMLRHVKQPLQPIGGSLTEIPFQTESFDFVYATESLEHAVEIETAVGELCRVLKPGGALVVIDKNKEHWGRFDTPAWERWFSRGELEGLLRKHCHSVVSRPISYWDDVAPDGLFLVWVARK